MGRRKVKVTTRKSNSFKQLQKALHEESGRTARQALLERHARLLASGSPHDGKVMVCRLSYAELRGELADLGSANKVIYDGWPQASAAARDLYRQDSSRQYPYLCPRTADGHHHLTSRPPWRRFNAPGVHKPPSLPAVATSRVEVEQLLSYEIMDNQRPPADVMSSGNDETIHAWFEAEISKRWNKIKKGTL